MLSISSYEYYFLSILVQSRINNTYRFFNDFIAFDIKILVNLTYL